MGMSGSLVQQAEADSSVQWSSSGSPPGVAWPSVRLRDYPIKEVLRSSMHGRALVDRSACVSASPELPENSPKRRLASAGWGRGDTRPRQVSVAYVREWVPLSPDTFWAWHGAEEAAGRSCVNAVHMYVKGQLGPPSCSSCCRADLAF